MAANTEMLGTELFVKLSVARAVIKADVQFNEGVNNMLKTEAKRSPTIGLPLLDARMRLKTRLQQYEKDAAKWHERKKLAHQVALEKRKRAHSNPP